MVKNRIMRDTQSPSDVLSAGETFGRKSLNLRKVFRSKEILTRDIPVEIVCGSLTITTKVSKIFAGKIIGV